MATSVEGERKGKESVGSHVDGGLSSVHKGPTDWGRITAHVDSNSEGNTKLSFDFKFRNKATVLYDPLLRHPLSSRRILRHVWRLHVVRLCASSPLIYSLGSDCELPAPHITPTPAGSYTIAGHSRRAIW